jgi:ribonuclease P/MRP protein subunit RPP40
LFVNAQSLNNNLKFEELKANAVEWKLDIIGIAETFLVGAINKSEISIEGFSLYRKDREEVKPGMKGGGVVLYVRDSLSSSECEALRKFGTESVFCKIITERNNELIVGVCYKSPNADDEEIEQLFQAIRESSISHVILMGDFNYPGIDWKNLDSDSHGRDFLELVQDCFLFQHVDRATRGANTLDLVLTSEETMIENLEIKEHLGTSDHNIVTWKLICKTDMSRTNTKYYAFKKADYLGMNEWLSKVNWDVEFDNLGVEDMWTKFMEIINNSIEKFVPISQRKINKFPVWMTRKAMKKRKYKSAMWEKYRVSSSYSDWAEYKIALKRATGEYRRAKRNFEKKIARNIKNDPKSFYAYVRGKAKTKDKVGPLKNSIGELVTNDDEMCNVLNKYFGTVFTDEDITKGLPEVDHVFRSDQGGVLTDIEIDSELVIKKLGKLKANKAPGVDGLVSNLFLETAVNMGQPLCLIFRKSLAEGIVPRDWRQANVSAIFKSGPKQEPGNYRPVSLTAQACKILESILRDAMVEHLRRYKLIKDTQHGFVKNKSCLTNLLEFLEYVSEYVDKGMPIDVIYLDFRKAFDKVPHKRLLLKVRAHGINGKIARWIEEWLKEREQRVVLNGKSSDWVKVKSGVPQGSVLGPLLFVIYINDIDKNINSKLLKFADDTKVFSVVETQEEVAMLRDDLKTLCEWSNDWLMLFNVEKCKVMHLGKKNLGAGYSMNGNDLEVIQEERDLGVIVQSDLKVSAQCAKVVKTANRVLGMVRRTFECRSKDIILNLYKSLVRPHLEYCVQAWSPHLRKDIELIERVQHRATKMIHGFAKYSYEKRLAILGMTTLETRRVRGDIIEVFKILKGFDEVNSSKFFELADTRCRGNSLKLHKERFNRNLGKFTFSNRIVNAWNRLPEEVVSCDTVNNFKIKLDHFIKEGRGFI